MFEYAVLIAMVIFAVGFAWLWFIEQKKKRKRKEALQHYFVTQNAAARPTSWFNWGGRAVAVRGAGYRSGYRRYDVVRPR